MAARSVLAGVVLAVLVSGIAHAACTYDTESDTISVVDYLESVPCTLKAILLADKMNGWGKVTHDKASDTYTVVCDLKIGTNDGTDSYLQLGTASTPRETLVMRGNLIVAPYWVSGEGPAKEWTQAPRAVNRLTLGDPDDKTIAPTVKFDCSPDRRFTVYVGVVLTDDNRFKTGHGGQLHVYNGTFTALTQKKGSEFGTPGRHAGLVMMGDSIILDGATISWVAGSMAYGISGRAQVADTVFEHGTSVTYGGVGPHNWSGCTFRHFSGAPIFDSGGLRMTLTDCTFENNVRNWNLHYTKHGLTGIDCNIGAPGQPDSHAMWIKPETGEEHHPTFTSKRHIVVEVVDENGKPVPGAAVKVRCEQVAVQTVENGEQNANADGRTPAKGEESPILLTEALRRASDTPNKPEVKRYSFSIDASSDGFVASSVKALRPAESWEIVRIVLEKRPR